MSRHQQIIKNQGASGHCRGSLTVPVFLRCNPEFFLKDSVEVAQVAVAHRFPDFVHMEAGVLQKIGGLGQALFLEQLLEGFPRPALDLPAEPA